MELTTQNSKPFAELLEPWHLLKHPFYQAWMAGTVTREQLKDYAGQYFKHVDAFPRYLGALHSNCENAHQRRHILDNLNDEEGVNHGLSHPELWLRFAEGLGLSREEVMAAQARPAMQKLIATFHEQSRDSYAEGLGTLFAYESQVPEIAESKIKGLKENYGVKDERTLEFFAVHRGADVYHRATLQSLIDQLSPTDRAKAETAMLTAAKALWNFLSDVHVYAA